ncbi:MAG: hypothetical protein AB7L09_22230 [Nitrospira sp.]
MGLREYIFELITEDSQMNALGINFESTFSQHSVDTPQIRPMCILRWGDTPEPIVSDFPVNQRTLTVWVHDSIADADYGQIDQALRRLRALLTSVQGVDVGGGVGWLSGIKWEGDSSDLRDDDAGTIMRNAQFRLTGSAI